MGLFWIKLAGGKSISANIGHCKQRESADSVSTKPKLFCSPRYIAKTERKGVYGVDNIADITNLKCVCAHHCVLVCHAKTEKKKIV